MRLSDTRDQVAAEAFLSQDEQTAGMDTTPTQITSDKEVALYPAIAKVFPEANHRDVKYKNNIIESDHCGIKSRYRGMRGFKNPHSVLIFCTAFNEVREHFNREKMTRAQRRSATPSKIQEFSKMFQAC